MKFFIRNFFENLSRYFRVNLNLARITGTLHEYLCIFVVVSFRIIRIMRNVSDKSCREYQNIFLYLGIFFPKIVPFFEILWKKYGRAPLVTDENMIRRICFARWIIKATDAYSEDVIPNAFP